MSAERDSKGQFIKGQSGNPSGRKKGVTAQVRDLSNNFEDYIKLLDQWARDENLSIKERRACIKDLLDRSLGMPKQSISAEIESPETIRFVLKDDE